MSTDIALIDGTPSVFSRGQLAKAAMAALMPRRCLMVRGRRGGRQVYLTFDDGPHPGNTPRLLDALGEGNVKATFFVVGQQVERHPEIVERIAREGHDLGHHTYSHIRLEKISTLRLMQEIERTNKLLTEIAGTG